MNKTFFRYLLPLLMITTVGQSSANFSTDMEFITSNNSLFTIEFLCTALIASRVAKNLEKAGANQITVGNDTRQRTIPVTSLRRMFYLARALAESIVVYRDLVEPSSFLGINQNQYGYRCVIPKTLCDTAAAVMWIPWMLKMAGAITY